MNVVFKRFVISICIFGLCFSSLRPQKANAIAVVDDVVVVGGAIVATGALVGLMYQAGKYMGYDIDTSYADNYKTYLQKKVLDMAGSELSKYFGTASDGKTDYVKLTDDGYKMSRSQFSNDSKSTSYIPVSDSRTTKSTSPYSLNPFMDKGYYMQPYVANTNTTFCKIQVKYGDKFNYRFYINSNNIVRTDTFVPTNDCLISFRTSTDRGNNVLELAVSYDNGATWTKKLDSYCATCGSSYLAFFGYNTSSHTVYVPGDSVISSSDSTTTIEANESIAIPVSSNTTTLDDGTTQTRYDVKADSTASVYTDLSAKTFTDADTNTKTDTNTDTKANTADTGVIASTIDGISTFVGNLVTIVQQILDWLTGFIGNLIHALRDLLKEIFAPLINCVANIWDWCSHLVSDMAAAIGSIFAPLINSVTNIWDWCGNLVSSMAVSIGNVFGSMIDNIAKIWDWCGNLVSSMTVAIGNIFGTMIDDVAKIWDWCGNLVSSMTVAIGNVFGTLIDDVASIWDSIGTIIDGIASIPTTLINWFTIDWAEVALHINYIDIVKEHFKPFFDIVDLLINIESSPRSSDGKFYMAIPKEMGGNGEEQCVLDLTIGSVYVQTGRDIIKYGIWIGFLWYVLKMFSPKFNIG